LCLSKSVHQSREIVQRKCASGDQQDKPHNPLIRTIATNGRSPVRRLNEPASNQILVPYDGLYSAAPIRHPKSESAYLEIWLIVRKHFQAIVISTLVMLSLAIAASLLMTPKFQSTSTIEINKDSPDLMGLDNYDRSATQDMPDSMSVAIDTQTEANVLSAQSLAFAVVEQLGLESRKEFSLRPNPLLFGTDKDEIATMASEPLEKSPSKQKVVAKAFEKNLKVEPIPGTRLVTVSFLNPDARVAADVTNKLIDDYIDERIRTRFDATSQASEWLNKELAKLKSQVETSQANLANFENRAGMLGTDPDNNVVMARLAELNKQLTDAETDRILKEARYNLARTGDPELLSMADTSLSADQHSGGSPNDLNLLQQLRAQESQLRTQYAQAATKYGPAYPLLIQLKNQVNAADDAVKAEVTRIGRRAENDYLQARSTEDMLRTSFEKQKSVAVRLNDSAIQYGILKSEADSGQKLYQDLAGRFKSGGVLAALKSTNVVVVDRARPSSTPKKPSFPLNVGAGLLIGLFGGLALAFTREALDTTFASPQDLEQALNVPCVAVIPDTSKCRYLPRRLRRRSSQPRDVLQATSLPGHLREGFRSASTWFTDPQTEEARKVVLITSARPNEGKTTTSLNLAAELARGGKRVLLVEADLRRPRLQTILGLEPNAGLSGILDRPFGPSHDQSVNQSLDHSANRSLEVPCHPDLPSLYVLTAGQNAGRGHFELLGTKQMRNLIDGFRERYDCVVIDAPPVLLSTDAAILSRYADAVLIVARWTSSNRGSVVRARDLLMRVGAPVAGAVFNRANLEAPGLDTYYGLSKKEFRHYYGSSLVIDGRSDKGGKQ
jgi:succinoglycan biosynthesis transport protein ExoP